MTKSIDIRIARELELGNVSLNQTKSPLRHDALLEKIRHAGEVSKSQLATMCGYADANGKINFTAFYENLLEAKHFRLYTYFGHV